MTNEAADAAPDHREDILWVQESNGTTFFLLIAYAEGDSANAAGYLFRRPAGSDAKAENILATNDTLRAFWCSPEGHLWASSTTGLIWTTAPVPWAEQSDDPGLEFEAPEGDLVWRHIALPEQEHKRMRPNPMILGGTADDDVYVATFSGVIYHWDGKAWSQYFSGIGEPIGAIRARARDDVYAVGYGSTILHFDGKAWSTVADPDGSSGREILTGVVFEDDGNVLICGSRGRLLRGSAKTGFSVVERFDETSFIGMARVDGRLFFAAKAKGVFELTESGLKSLRDDIVPWSVAEGQERAYFTETPGETVYSEFDLGSAKWRRLSY